MSKKFTTRNKNSFKLSPVFIGVAMILTLLAGIAWLSFNNGNEKPKEQPTQSQINQVDYSEPSEEEKIAGDHQKDKILTPPSTNPIPNGDSDKKSVNVLITDAGQYDNEIEVRAFVKDHFEDGTCTIEFTKDNVKVTKDTAAFKDSSTTICTNPIFSRNEFSSAGEWKVIVSYNSSSAYGQSDPRSVTIK